MSNPVTAALAALVLGVAAGAVASWSEFRSDDLALVTSAASAQAPTAAPPVNSERVPHARALLEGEKTDFNFGSMQRGETRKHVFVVRNVGDAPLTLTQGKVSCTCTVSKLASNAVAPGATADVTLEWTPRTYAPDFRQTAEIITNDPERQVITLSISGRVTQAVRPVPEDLTLSRVTVSEPQTFTFKVFSFLSANLELGRMEVRPAKTAAFFSLAEEPLSAEEVAAEAGAKAGKKVTLTLKPGLPLGPLHHTIYIETNQKDAPPIEMPLKGTVISDISLVPKGDLDVEENIFRLGAVSSSEGKSATLHLTVKGKNPSAIKLSIGEIVPADALQATIGEPKSINGGEVLIYPVTITVPVGAPSVNHLGGVSSPFGTVVIKTTHPTAPTMTLHVRFAVE